MPRPSRLGSCTTRVTATPDARISRARVTARSSSGRLVTRVEIFSEKTRLTLASFRESSWVSRDWRTVEARAYPIRTCPTGSTPATTGRGSSTQTEPGRRTAGDRHVEVLGQGRHQPEPGSVVLNSNPPLAGPARRPGRGSARRHGAVVALHAQEIVVAHPGIVSCGRFKHQVICTDP